MIQGYTREAGLRSLEREVASVCRKIARDKAAQGAEFKSEVVTAKRIPKLLGPVKYVQDPPREESEVGVTTGLAWTQAGGETLTIEATFVEGKGSIELTGQLGDVMKESARAALSYVRTRAEELGLAKNFFAEHDLHLHIPAGAIPKDGPSAGITIATTLISLLCSVAVKRDVAMTGEVTLLGKVLPIGGVKEKILAAVRQDINHIILPKSNEKDLVDLPKTVRSKIEVTLVENMDQVLSAALAGKLPLIPGGGRRLRRKPAAHPSSVH